MSPAHHEFREAVLRRYVVSPARFFEAFPRHRNVGRLKPAYQFGLSNLLFQSDLSDVSADMNFILLDLLIAHPYALHV